MNFLEVNSNLEITIVPEVLLIKEFNAIVKRDTSKEQLRAKKELAMVAFFVKVNSPYAKYDKLERMKKLSEDFGLVFDNVLLVAADKYETLFIDFTMYALITYKETIRKTLKYFKTLEFDEVDKNGKPLHKPKEIYDAINQGPKVLQAIEDAEKRLKEGFSATGIKSTKDRVVGKGEIPTNVNVEPLKKDLR